MTGPARPVGEDDLLAYADGAVDPAREALVRDWLTGHPEAAARIEADRRGDAALRAALAPLAEAPIPARLRVARVDAARRARFAARARSLAAALALLALGGAAGWGLRGLAAGGESGALAADALAAYRTYVVEKRHPVEVGADASAHLGAWLSNRLGRPISIPDLSADGLRLVGGRLLPGPEAPAALLMYQDSSGRRLTLYLRATPGGDARFALATRDGASALTWVDDGFGYALAAPYGETRLMEIAHRVHRTLDG